MTHFLFSSSLFINEDNKKCIQVIVLTYFVPVSIRILQKLYLKQIQKHNAVKCVQISNTCFFFKTRVRIIALINSIHKIALQPKVISELGLSAGYTKRLKTHVNHAIVAAIGFAHVKLSEKLLPLSHLKTFLNENDYKTSEHISSRRMWP